MSHVTGVSQHNYECRASHVQGEPARSLGGGRVGAIALMLKCLRILGPKWRRSNSDKMSFSVEFVPLI